MGTDFNGDPPNRQRSSASMRSRGAHKIAVSLLTGGGDKPYVFGLTTSLLSQGVALDLIGSNELDCPDFRNKSSLRFLNLRGDQNSGASFVRKVFRVLKYYGKLIRYAATARPEIFHILWNNKFEIFDRTLLMLHYRCLGKKIALTVHNVNAGKRDGKDTRLNRLTLRIQYQLAHHIFVHTEKMKLELVEEFGIPNARITVIPFGINNAVPNTSLTSANAKQQLGIGKNERTILFFGNITPYKGLDYLIAAFRRIMAHRKDYRLIIAGRPDKCEEYWDTMRDKLHANVQRGRLHLRADFIPDHEVEVYFKAADALVLPYREIYQSGVLFLAYSFGLPVLAADVGSLKDDIVEGETGFVFRPEDELDLARVIERYFASDLYANLDRRRQGIRHYATERHSWDVVASTTMRVYAGLRMPSARESLDCDAKSTYVNLNAP